MPDPTSPKPPALDTLLAALMYLMSRHAADPNAELAEAICFHLELLARRQDAPMESLGQAARRLWPVWRGLSMGCEAVVVRHTSGQVQGLSLV